MFNLKQIAGIFGFSFPEEWVVAVTVEVDLRPHIRVPGGTLFQVLQRDRRIEVG